VATRSGSLGAGAQERHFGRKSTDWIAAHHAGITLSLRITVAGLIALAICELLGVRQVYWAVLTALIVIQASVGGSLGDHRSAGRHRRAGAQWRPFKLEDGRRASLPAFSGAYGFASGSRVEVSLFQRGDGALVAYDAIAI